MTASPGPPRLVGGPAQGWHLRALQIMHIMGRMRQTLAPPAITARVAAAVRRSGIRQDALAQALGLERTSVSRRITGAVNWRVHELHQVATLLGTTVDDLIGGDNDD